MKSVKPLNIVKKVSIVSIVVSTLFISACATDPVFDAFSGDYEIVKETKVIVGYCQSCHIHKNFDSISHLEEQPYNYSNTPFSTAGDCKTCHSISKDFWGTVKRDTHRPSDVKG